MPASVAHLITPEKVFRLAAKGMSQELIARGLGVARSALQLYLKNDSELRAAYKRGVEQDIFEVESALKDMATKKCQPVAAIFYLKNKAPDRWKDKRDIEHSGTLNLSVANPWDDAKVIDGESEET